jgi:hypothetical protein
MVITCRPVASVFDVVIDVAEEINHIFLHVFMIEKSVCTDHVCFLYHKVYLIAIYPEAAHYFA